MATLVDLYAFTTDTVVSVALSQPLEPNSASSIIIKATATDNTSVGLFSKELLVQRVGEGMTEILTNFVDQSYKKAGAGSWQLTFVPTTYGFEVHVVGEIGKNICWSGDATIRMTVCPPR